MTFIETVPEAEASGPVAELYAADRAAFGRLPNFTQAFSLRPDVYAAWKGLSGAVRGNMDLRRYELVTLAAARRLRSSYCMLAHGTILAERFLPPEDLRALAAEDGTDVLDEVDVAVMALAEKVVDDATSVTEADVDHLRSRGLSDADVLDVVLAAALRCFFSKSLDGLGVLPDRDYRETLDPELREALTVGRPVAD